MSRLRRYVPWILLAIVIAAETFAMGWMLADCHQFVWSVL